MIIKKQKKKPSAYTTGHQGLDEHGQPIGLDIDPTMAGESMQGWTIEGDEELAELYEGDLTIDELIASNEASRQVDRRHSLRQADEVALIGKAQQEANSIRQQAAQEGFQEGLKQAQPLMEELRQNIEQFYSAKQRALELASQDIAPIVLEVVEQVLQIEASCDEGLVVHLIKKTVQQLDKDTKRMVVKVNPNDVDRLEAHFTEHPPLKGEVDWYVEPDTEVDPGSCMVETEAGLIDARFSTQLEVLKDLVTKGGSA